MVESLKNRENYRHTIYTQWQRLVDGGISVDQVVEYLGRPDLKEVFTLSNTNVSIAKFKIDQFIKENESLLNPIFLPDVKSFFPTEEKDTRVSLRSLAIFTGQKESFLKEIIRRKNFEIDTEMFLSQESTKIILAELEEGIWIDDWIFWENYPVEVANAIRAVIKKNNEK